MMFFRFFSAWARTTWARWRGYETLASPSIMALRFNQCVPCEFFVDGVCTACDCLVQAKIMLAMEKCPKKRWQRVYTRRVTVRE